MKFQSFLERKKITLSWKNYFVTAMGAMAQGLFASLLIGTILGTLATWTGWEFLSDIADFAKNNYVVGAAIGVAVAAALKADGLVLFTCAVVGAMGYVMGAEIPNGALCTAGPAGSFVAVLFACEFGKLVSKETKVDILVTPIVTILVGFAVSMLLCPIIAYGMYYLGDFINNATEMHPFLMGMIVAVVVGILLTLPVSSAAICAMIGGTGIIGIAGGAATAGCCCQMIGFAVMSFRENRWGGLTAQGLGTSMLQMGNIVKRPVIWLPTILSSAIVGPIATCVFGMQNKGVAAGMGTCGLVGPLGVIANTPQMDWFAWLGLVLCCFVLPAAITLLFSELMRKFGWIRKGDLKLDL